MSAPTSPTSSPRLPVAPPVEGVALDQEAKAAAKAARRAARAAAAEAAASGSSPEPASSARRRSSPSSPIPGAEEAPAADAEGFNASGISAVIARVMVAARYLLSGNFDISGTINDMSLVERCVKKLAKRMDQCATAVNEVRTGVVNFATALPTVAEAVVRVTTTFAGAFPFIGRMFK